VTTGSLTSTFSCTYTPTTVGSYASLVANYSGDINYSSVSGSFSALSVNKATVTLTLTPNFTTLASNQSGTFTLALSGGYLTSLSGLTVTSTSGTYSLSLSGTASPYKVTMSVPASNTSLLAVTITATYSDANNTTTSSTSTFTPTTAFGYTAVIGNLTVTAPGQSATGTITLTTTGGFDPTQVSFNAITSTSGVAGVSFGPVTAFTKTASNTYTASFTLATTAASTAVHRVTAGVGKPGPLEIITILFSMLLFIGFQEWTLARRFSVMLLLLVGLISLNACGGGGKSATTSNATPVGSYNVTATVSNASTAASTSTATLGGYPGLSAQAPSFTLTVQ
jgi:hypothetical protein